ncbi:rhomboid family intramembrane serine protease [Dysgonomonas sp. OttesenSCG-928-M03]|nr:rhomboid family intramembrane serine protease [Dysgonomonas sp. OttesenSCG-928-M03]
MTYNRKNNQIVSSLKYSFVFIVIFWIVEVIQILGFDFADYGILPRQTIGLTGIITSPFIHGDLQHLIANTIPFFVLSFLLFLFYKRRAGVFLVLIWLTTGILTWIIGRTAWHIGASGVIYGLASFLVFGGILSRNWKLIFVSILVLILYSSLVWGIFPGDARISWEGHLSGAISGLIWAVIYKKILRSPEYK